MAVGAIPLAYFCKVEYGTAQTLNGNNGVAMLDSDTAAGAPKNQTAEKDPLDRGARNLSFGVGEELVFDINYGFINAGEAHMRVLDIVEWAGRPCYYVQTQAHSNSFFDSIFPVNDTVETIIDVVGLASWRFDKRLREGTYKSDLLYTFDLINNLAIYEGDTTEAPPFIQDVLSSFYYVRTLDLKVGSSVIMQNFTRGKVAPFEVKVLRKETIEVPAGEFDCIVVEPLLKAAGVFKHEGRMTVWLTDDRLKMPVRMKSKVIVGSIDVTLKAYKLGEIEQF
jgi:Protein of unknown function (DUF3108)